MTWWDVVTEAVIPALAIFAAGYVAIRVQRKEFERQAAQRLREDRFRWAGDAVELNMRIAFRPDRHRDQALRTEVAMRNTRWLVDMPNDDRYVVAWVLSLQDELLRRPPGRGTAVKPATSRLLLTANDRLISWARGDTPGRWFRDNPITAPTAGGRSPERAASWRARGPRGPRWTSLRHPRR